MTSAVPSQLLPTKIAARRPLPGFVGAGVLARAGEARSASARTAIANGFVRRAVRAGS
jgi:hypothetical protein